MTIYNIKLIELEWNCLNGFIVSILTLDMKKPNIDSALFGINVSKDFMYMDILFFSIKIFDKL